MVTKAKTADRIKNYLATDTQSATSRGYDLLGRSLPRTYLLGPRVGPGTQDEVVLGRFGPTWQVLLRISGPILLKIHTTITTTVTASSSLRT